MILPPTSGDIYIVLKPVPMNEVVKYKVGGTVTLISEINASEEKWRCIDEFGIGEWTWISYRVEQGELRLLCKQRK